MMVDCLERKPFYLLHLEAGPLLALIGGRRVLLDKKHLLCLALCAYFSRQLDILNCFLRAELTFFFPGEKTHRGQCYYYEITSSPPT